MTAWLPDALQDIQFAARTLRKRPGFATAAVVTLALGIGAASAVFSIVDAVLLRPLPYKDPARLVAIFDKGNQSNLAAIFASYADYDAFRNARSFESISAATWAGRVRLGRVMTGRGPARTVLAVPVTASFFGMLGAFAAHGRTFSSSDENHGCVVVLTHSFWTSKLGADPGIVGQSLTLDHKTCAVLGVMGPAFAFYPRQAEMWILLGADFDAPREQLPVGSFARLKPGVTIQQAQAEAGALHRALHQGDGKETDIEPVVTPLQNEFMFLASRTLRTTLLMVFAAVALVLLIACLNLSNLLMGKLAERSRELAVRTALGSGRGRLVRQVLTEGLLLSLMGAAGGIALAFAAVRYFNSANPIELTVGSDIQVNLAVLLFSEFLAVTATLIFGMLPAIQVSRVNVTEGLRAAGRGTVSGHGFRGVKALIVVEMGLSLILLSGASLLLESALQMGSADLGFDPHDIMHARVSLPAAKYPGPAQRGEFYRALLDRVNQLRGVAAAAMASSIPPYSGAGGGYLEIQGRTPPDHPPYDTGEDAVTPGYFEALKTPLLRGRNFDSRDRLGVEPTAIVNQALVDKYFPRTDALGQQVRLGGVGMPWLTIVGVVGNIKHGELMNEMKWVESPALYRPLSQEAPGAATIVVRRAREQDNLGGQIQQAVSGTDADIPVSDAETLESDLSKSVEYPRFRAAVLSMFALGALLLSAIGLHGVLAQVVAQRTAEFGLRRAVGAQTGHLLGLVAREGGIPVAIGLAGGLAGSIAAARVLAALLYGLQPADPRALTVASLILVTVAASAIAIPAWRATRIDPLTALRGE